jgi:cell division septation protein DedD
VDVPPPDYTPPIAVYLVEEASETGEVAQIGGFFSEEEANTLLERLRVEGREAHINVVPIHRRAADYEYDR